MSKNQIKLIVSELRSRLLELYSDRLVKVILFGSQARETANIDSDIDILIVLKGEVNIGDEIERTGVIVSQLSLDYSTVISRLFMSEDYFENYQSALLRNIRAEGITI